jgi:hypothetical protein
LNGDDCQASAELGGALALLRQKPSQNELENDPHLRNRQLFVIGLLELAHEELERLVEAADNEVLQ